MTPAAIIREAQADGVTLALSTTGTIKATGDVAAVNRWLAAIREHKAKIIDALKVGAGDTMSLSNLIRRKSAPEAFATATLATFATLEGEKGRTVASVATVAVAKSTKWQTAPLPKVGAGETAPASRLQPMQNSGMAPAQGRHPWHGHRSRLL